MSALSSHRIRAYPTAESQNITYDPSRVISPRPETKLKSQSKSFIIKQVYSNGSLMPRLTSAKEQSRTQIRENRKKQSHVTQKSVSDQPFVSTPIFQDRVIMHPISEKAKKPKIKKVKVPEKYLIYQAYSSPSSSLGFADSPSHLRNISISSLTVKGKHSADNNVTPTRSLASRQLKERPSFFSQNI